MRMVRGGGGRGGGCWGCGWGWVGLVQLGGWMWGDLGWGDGCLGMVCAVAVGRSPLAFLGLLRERESMKSSEDKMWYA